ncbi:MAG: HAMP domain-containing sensor histidine kinase [Clostridium sp.]
MQNLIFEIVVIVLLGILCISFIMYRLLLKNIDNLKDDISELNNKDTNEMLKVKYPSKHVEQLVCEINKGITSKREVEEKYRGSDLELRQAIANISHDLRTPLTSIIGYVQLLNDNNLSMEDRTEYVDIIERRSIVLRRLIGSFYDLSRLQANEYDLEFDKVNISSVLCEIMAAFYDDIEAKGLQPIIDIRDSNYIIKGDIKAINRIFTNLIQNILKYAKGNVNVKLYEEGNSIITEFSNDTININEIDVTRIFERFFTADKMRTGQNTGLGLAITKILVEKQGHEIWAEKNGNVLSVKIKWKMLISY